MERLPYTDAEYVAYENGTLRVAMMRSEAAYEWYDDPKHDKTFFIRFCRAHGVHLRARGPYLKPGWEHMTMHLFDELARRKARR